MATNIPPHNLHELIDACQMMLRNPDVPDDALVDLVPGPDFPTGGVIVEPRDAIMEAYRTGRGAFRLRAAWTLEDLGRGTWQIVVTQIPFQVQKSRLIERLAELIQTKKVPALADVRDESAEDVRIVLEPRARSVDPEMLMGMLFRNSDLETRFSMNMNVLIDGRVPRVCSLKEVLRAFLDHRRDVLRRRSRHRLEKIDARLEILEGFIIAFLNLDRVIDIIREEEESFGRTLGNGIMLFDELCVEVFKKARLIPHLQIAGATVHAVAHRWRYARVQTGLDDACVFDASRGIGACGDWGAAGATRRSHLSVERAWLSGVALAGRVLSRATS
jgi:DNA gyrase/topoisomerase IV subunit A